MEREHWKFRVWQSDAAELHSRNEETKLKRPIRNGRVGTIWKKTMPQSWRCSHWIKWKQGQSAIKNYGYV